MYLYLSHHPMSHDLSYFWTKLKSNTFAFYTRYRNILYIHVSNTRSLRHQGWNVYNTCTILLTIPAFSQQSVRPAISQASCRRLPAFQFDYRLTGIGDNFAGNYVKYKQTSYSEMYAFNCNQRRTLPLFTV